MQWYRRVVQLQPRRRGFHLVTDEIVAQLPELARLRTGLLHLFIQHTSASLVINENASPDVRRDLERQLQDIVPDGPHHYEHVHEGPDDMSAHVKSCLLGSGLTIPIGGGSLLLGTWQGIYLGEHRNNGGARTIVATMLGD
jgi:secondary thiamine-phosphate synthase enzyme